MIFGRRKEKLSLLPSDQRFPDDLLAISDDDCTVEAEMQIKLSEILAFLREIVL